MTLTATLNPSPELPCFYLPATLQFHKTQVGQADVMTHYIIDLFTCTKIPLRPEAMERDQVLIQKEMV